MRKTLSVVIPAYNESAVIAQTAAAVSAIFANEEAELTIIVVDDGSTDDTWATLQLLTKESPLVKGLRLSRNFGKESAIFAGLSYADSDCTIIMDGDMQHPPETALAMYRLWAEGRYKIVEAVKIHRQRESFLHRLFAQIFYALLKLCCGMSLQNMSDFKLLDRQVADILKRMPERSTFFRAMTGWVGFETGYVHFETAPRAGGKTKFKPASLIRLAVDSITSYSSLPLQLVTIFGIGFIIFAGIMFAQTLFMKFSGRSVEGFTTVIVLLLLIGGVLMMSLGMIGVYIAKIYNEIKNRPRFLISERTL